jgi:hypothetical protein
MALINSFQTQRHERKKRQNKKSKSKVIGMPLGVGILECNKISRFQAFTTSQEIPGRNEIQNIRLVHEKMRWVQRNRPRVSGSPYLDPDCEGPEDNPIQHQTKNKYKMHTNSKSSQEVEQRRPEIHLRVITRALSLKYMMAGWQGYQSNTRNR